MIQIKNLHVQREAAVICSVPHLSVSAGQRVGILGANGSGKTTLLRVIAGLERNFQGKCDVGVPRRERVYVHQNPYLFRGTVLYNALYGLRARGLNGAAGERIALSALDRFGIADLASRKVHHLSGGERRRTALVRALVLKPRVLLLDEPLADMDDKGTAEVCTLLRELEDTTILIASPVELPAGLINTSFRFGPLKV